MMRRRKRALTLLGLGLTATAAVIFIGALAVAQPADTQGFVANAPAATAAAADRPEARASRAAAALADAHPGDRAVGYLSDIAQREIARIAGAPQTGSDQILDGFSRRAEEHLIQGSNNPAEAQQMLRQTIQQLRGSSGAGSPAATPAASEAPTEANAFGRNLVVDADQTVTEASVVGGDLTVRGHVLRDAVAVGGSLVLEPGARVDGDAVSVGGDIRIDPGTRVEGDAVSVGGHASIADGAYVGGDRNQIGAGSLITRPLVSGSGSGVLAWIGGVVKKVGLGLVMALLCIVIAALAPNRVRTVITTVRQRPLMSFFSGLLALVVTTTASVLLAITLIGIPLVPVIWIGVALAALFGMTGVAALVGEAMPGRGRAHRSALRAIVLGVAFLTVVSLLPWHLGWVLIWLLISAALGAVILSRVGAVEPHH